jgi:RND superfamily putative drug exporter
MRDKFFYQWGCLLYRLRWFVIITWVLLIAACIPFVRDIITPFKTTGFVADQSASVQADNYLNKKLGYNKNRFMVIYQTDKMSFSNPAFSHAIKKSLQSLNDFPLSHEIIYPDENDKQVSADKHTAYAVILFRSNEPMNHAVLEQFKASIKKPPQITMHMGGEPIFVEGVNKQTQKDLYKADFIATPVSIITLLLVFGSVVAAVLPIVLGGGCALLILTTLYFIGHVFTLSIFTLNIALLLGYA